MNKTDFTESDDTCDENHLASKEELEKLFNDANFENRFDLRNCKIFIDNVKWTKDDLDKYLANRS